jgi:hypothetical protein
MHGHKEVKRMAKKRVVIFRDPIGDFSRKGWEGKAIGVKGNIILIEAEVPEEETANRRPMAIEDLINEPGEC